MTKWYDQPLEQKPGDTIETPLGSLKIEVGERYSIHAELTAFVRINTILCRVAVNSTLSMQREDWTHQCFVDRVREFDPPRYGQKWEIAGSATDNARKKARAAVLPLLEKWIDEHFHELEQGRLIAERNLIQQAHHRLDDALREIRERRAELNAMSEYLDYHGVLKDSDRSLLADLWSWHWRF